jgi:gliding motility-associated-like protein
VFENNEDPYSIVRELDQGENLLTWTIDYLGCRTVDTIVVKNNNPTTAFAGDNISLCGENRTKLSANDTTIGRGKWSVVEGGAVFTDPADKDTYVDSLKFGDNILRWTMISDDGMCVSYDDIQVSYNRIEAYAGPDSIVTCNADTLLEANSALPGVGTWTVVGGGGNQASFEDVNAPNTRVYNLAKGVNTLRWTVDYRGCETYDEVQVINNSPSIAYAGNLQELCEDHTTLDATKPSIGKGHWTIISGSAVIEDSLDWKSEVSGLSKGYNNVLRWVIENGGCRSHDDVVIINNNPSQPYAGEDEEVCYDHLKLKANAPDYGAGIWSILSGSGNFINPNDPGTEITNLSAGNNYLIWTVVKGQCSLADTVIVYNNAATTANAGPDVINCVDSVRLDANIPEGEQEGFWTLISGAAEFDKENDPKSIARKLGSGKNIFMWTITNGSCFSKDTVVVVNQVPDQAFAGDGYTICSDQTVLNANVPVSGHGQWSILSGMGNFEDPARYDTKVSNIGFGENVYKWTISYPNSGCSTSDTIIITSYKADAYAGKDATVYEPEYKMKAANPGKLEAEWSVVAGHGEFVDSSFFATRVYNLNIGANTFRWAIDINGCKSYDDVTVTYKQAVEAGFEVDKETGCYPLEVDFTNYTVGGDEFHWDFGDGGTSDERHPVHVYKESGVFNVIMSVPGPDGQNVEYSKIITVYDHPVADFDVKPTVVYIPDEVVRLYNLSVDGKTYLWDFGDDTTSDDFNPDHEYTDEGVYSISLTVQNEYGCEDVMLKEDVVQVKIAGFIAFPNAFMPRPSGDVRDVNAIFKPVYRDVDEYTLQIFNRWGQLIFESHDITKGWNGFYKGKLAPQAVYVWKVSGTYVSGKEFHKNGSVLLVR